jgi:hypothetical protein
MPVKPKGKHVEKWKITPLCTALSSELGLLEATKDAISLSYQKVKPSS